MSIRQLRNKHPRLFQHEAGNQYTYGSFGGLDDEDYIDDILGLGEDFYDKYLGKYKFTSRDEAKLIRYFYLNYSNCNSFKDAKESAEEEICMFHFKGWIEYWSPNRLKRYQHKWGYVEPSNDQGGSI